MSICVIFCTAKITDEPRFKGWLSDLSLSMPDIKLLLWNGSSDDYRLKSVCAPLQVFICLSVWVLGATYSEPVMYREVQSPSIPSLNLSTCRSGGTSVYLRATRSYWPSHTLTSKFTTSSLWYNAFTTKDKSRLQWIICSAKRLIGCNLRSLEKLWLTPPRSKKSLKKALALHHI